MKSLFLAAMIALGLASLAVAPAAGQQLVPQLIASGLAYPLGVANARDGSNRLFILEQGGTIRIFDGTQVLPTPFMDISGKVLFSGERGLLGLAFDPNYASNGFFYVYYTSRPSGEITIARYSVTGNPNVANPMSEVILKTQAHATNSNHNGGSLAFGMDNCLYAGIGDGGGGGDPDGNGQNLGTLLGKIIRISSTDGTPCAAAPGNPFVGMGGAMPEIWALGVRNPWRITFDRQTGDLFIADVGQGAREEVDFQAPGVAGRNYCWRGKEGTLVYDGGTPCTTGAPTDPVLEYDHSDGKCSITGGYRYRGSALATYAGVYFYADFCTGMIWGGIENGGMWSSTLLLSTGFNISTFGEDERGEIYFTHYAASGNIYRLTPNASPRTNTADFNGDGKSDILWRNDDGSVAEWLMNGGSFAGLFLAAGVPNSWHIVGTGDFNGDGKADILWRHDDGSVAIWLTAGSSVAGAIVALGVTNTWHIDAVGDFDGDAKSDILWRHDDGSIAIWFMNGGAIASGAVIASGVDTNWHITAVGDFNGDSKSDLLWRYTDGSVALWLMNGGSFAGAAVASGISNDWQIAGAGDFNGDGKTDILWRYTDGSVAIWFMNGGTIATGANVAAGVPNTWQIVGIGDVNGDGKSDVLWRASDGSVGLWQMNGGAFTGVVLASGVPASWATYQFPVVSASGP